MDTDKRDRPACTFERIDAASVRCTACGRVVRYSGDQHVDARCRVGVPALAGVSLQQIAITPDDCPHRGEESRRQRCATCSGEVQLKIFQCGLHQECSLAKQIPGVSCCAMCPDHPARTVV